MPIGPQDVTLTASADGSDTSKAIFADYFHNFATKALAGTTYDYEFVDEDGFGIYGENGIQGPYAKEINRRVKNIVVTIRNAPPGAIVIFRLGAD